MKQVLVNLKAEMERFGITTADLGKCVGKTERAIKNRLNGLVEISSPDIIKIRNDYFPYYTLDYLLSESPIIVTPIPDMNADHAS